MSNPIIGRGWHFPPMLDERGMIALTNDYDEIEQSIRIILSTAPGQRVMRPEFGCRIHELVFAPNSSATAGQAIRYVGEALGRWEPRIDLQEVNALDDPGRDGVMLIEIKYQIKDTHDERSIVYPFFLMGEEEPI